MISKSEFCRNIAHFAVKSLLFEVSATPKPGLVDRNNSGAHKDMDFFTFMSSSSALFDTFYNCALEGIKDDYSNYSELLNKIRPIGIIGEEKMFKATKGVNTHKGLIFLLGIISAAAGSLQKENRRNQNINAENICKRVMEMTEGLSQRELSGLYNKKELTYGEGLAVRYGIKGVRGEAESGFKTVMDFGLPVMKRLMKENKDFNDVMVQVLINLMTQTEDSNVLGRHDLRALVYVRNCAKEAIELGGAFTREGMQCIEKMDKDFIKANISPGGSADLLAVTVMFYLVDNI